MRFRGGHPLIPRELDGFAFRRFVLYPFLLKPLPVSEGGGIMIRNPLLVRGGVLNAPIGVSHGKFHEAALGIARSKHGLEKRGGVQGAFYVFDHARGETLERWEAHLGHGLFHPFSECVTVWYALDVLPHLRSIGTNGSRVQEIIDTEGLEGHAVGQTGRGGAESDLIRIESHPLHGLCDIADGTSHLDAQLGRRFHRIGGIVGGAKEAEFRGNGTRENGGTLLGPLLWRLSIGCAPYPIVRIANEIL